MDIETKVGVFLLAIFIILFSGLATAGLIKGAFRGASANWVIYQKQSSLLFWFYILLYYALSISLLVLLLLCNFRK